MTQPCKFACVSGLLTTAAIIQPLSRRQKGSNSELLLNTTGSNSALDHYRASNS